MAPRGHCGPGAIVIAVLLAFFCLGGSLAAGEAIKPQPAKPVPTTAAAAPAAQKVPTLAKPPAAAPVNSQAAAVPAAKPSAVQPGMPTAAVQPSAAVQGPASEADQPIRLYLVATYGEGVTRPGHGVKLIADAIMSKHVDCIQEQAVAVTARPFGSHNRERPKTHAAKDAQSPPPVPAPADDGYDDAVMLPMIQSNMKHTQHDLHLQQDNAAAAPNTTTASAMSVPPEAVAVAKDPPAAAQCHGLYALQPGLYSLLAASVEGADWASWSCLAYQTSIKAGKGMANITAVEMYSPGAVELVSGFTYTCIAYYPKSIAATVAAAKAKDWDSSVSEAALAAVAAAAAAGCKPVSYQPPQRGVPAPPIQIQGNRLTAGGKPFTIHGINWFGFNVPMGVVDGLWAGGTDLATDFGKIVYQLKLLGYNAVRLPYTHRNLQNTQVSDVVRECAATNEDQLRQRITDPNKRDQAKNKQLPANQSPLANKAGGSCNTYLPSANNMERMLFVVQQFIAQGMYVVLDYQPMGTEEYAYDLHKFVTQWALVWKQFTCLPNFGSDMAGRLFVDVMNEPDSMGIRWEANNDRPGAQQLYLGTADAIWAMTPNQAMFMFEGTGQNMLGLSWGNGFVTDHNLIQSRGLSDANPFFQRLINKPYVKQVVITPHVYPPTITGATFLGRDLWDQSRSAFGYLQSPGYCGASAVQTERGMATSAIAMTASLLSKITSSKFMSALLDGQISVAAVNNTAKEPPAKAPGSLKPQPDKKQSCTVFPVVIGETGSSFASATDKTWLNDFADFINAAGGAASYNNVPLAGWLWWAYNENSGDTGGIVMNTWQDINWEKVRFMSDKLGLTAWHVNAPNRQPQPPSPPPKPSPAPPVKPPPKPPAAKPPAPQPPAPQPPAAKPPAPKPPAPQPPAAKPPAPQPPAPQPPAAKPPAPKPPAPQPPAAKPPAPQPPAAKPPAPQPPAAKPPAPKPPAAKPPAPQPPAAKPPAPQPPAAKPPAPKPPAAKPPAPKPPAPQPPATPPRLPAPPVPSVPSVPPPTPGRPHRPRRPRVPRNPGRLPGRVPPSFGAAPPSVGARPGLGAAPPGMGVRPPFGGAPPTMGARPGFGSPFNPTPGGNQPRGRDAFDDRDMHDQRPDFEEPQRDEDERIPPGSGFRPPFGEVARPAPGQRPHGQRPRPIGVRPIRELPDELEDSEELLRRSAPRHSRPTHPRPGSGRLHGNGIETPTTPPSEAKTSYGGDQHVTREYQNSGWSDYPTRSPYQDVYHSYEHENSEEDHEGGKGYYDHYEHDAHEYEGSEHGRDDPEHESDPDDDSKSSVNKKLNGPAVKVPKQRHSSHAAKDGEESDTHDMKNLHGPGVKGANRKKSKKTAKSDKGDTSEKADRSDKSVNSDKSDDAKDPYYWIRKNQKSSGTKKEQTNGGKNDQTAAGDGKAEGPNADKKGLKHYKSLDGSDSTRTVTAPKQDSSKTADKQEPCTNPDDYKLPNGGYKFIPPGKRRNLCRPLDASSPNAAEQVQDGTQADGGASRNRNSNSNSNSNIGSSRRTPAPKKEGTARGDLPYYARKDLPPTEDEAEEDKGGEYGHNEEDDQYRHGDEEEEEGDDEHHQSKHYKRYQPYDEGSEEHTGEGKYDGNMDDEQHHQGGHGSQGKQGSGDSKKTGQDQQQATEEDEEEYPLPIVRDNFGFDVPGYVEDNFWVKANKMGLLYMPKWDPALAKYYNPKIDHAGNKLLAVNRHQLPSATKDTPAQQDGKQPSAEPRDPNSQGSNAEPGNQQSRRRVVQPPGGHIDTRVNRPVSDSQQRQRRVVKLPDGSSAWATQGSSADRRAPGTQTAAGRDSVPAAAHGMSHGNAGSRAAVHQRDNPTRPTPVPWEYQHAAETLQPLKQQAAATSKAAVQSSTAGSQGAQLVAEANSASNEPMYWAYVNGKMVPVYAEDMEADVFEAQVAVAAANTAAATPLSVDQQATAQPRSEKALLSSSTAVHTAAVPASKAAPAAGTQVAVAAAPTAVTQAVHGAAGSSAKVTAARSKTV